MKTIGVLATEHIATGAVENHKLSGETLIFPSGDEKLRGITAMRPDEIAEAIHQQAALVVGAEKAQAIGVGFPGIIREGVIQESPNLPQVKGFDLRGALERSLGAEHPGITVRVYNDADVMAAGIAATVDQLDKLVRVWTLGNGIGFGRYPCVEGVWEGGHITVSLDTKEAYCGCGGQGP